MNYANPSFVEDFSWQKLKLSAASWLGRLPMYAWEGTPLGTDDSSYQGLIDWQLQYAKGVRFAGIRSGLSWGTKDTRFDYNWTEARKAGIYRFAYHVLYPGESPEKQATFFHSLLGDDKGELPPAWDVELHHGYNKDFVTLAAHRVMDATSTWYGKSCILYTARWFTENYMQPEAWFNDFWWWLAQYLYANPLTGFAAEHPGPVALPTGVRYDRVLIHQTAGKYNSAGFGVESKMIDTDRWLPGLAHLRSMAGVTTTPLEQWTKEMDIWARLNGYTGVTPTGE